MMRLAEDVGRIFVFLEKTLPYSWKIREFFPRTQLFAPHPLPFHHTKMARICGDKMAIFSPFNTLQKNNNNGVINMRYPCIKTVST